MLSNITICIIAVIMGILGIYFLLRNKAKKDLLIGFCFIFLYLGATLLIPITQNIIQTNGEAYKLAINQNELQIASDKIKVKTTTTSKSYSFDCLSIYETKKDSYILVRRFMGGEYVEGLFLNSDDLDSLGLKFVAKKF